MKIKTLTQKYELDQQSILNRGRGCCQQTCTKSTVMSVSLPVHICHSG